MCLYTDKKATEDMTGIVAYKRYKIIDGSLVTVIQDAKATSLMQVAEGPKPDPEPIKANWQMKYGPMLRIGPGYIHAHLTLESSIAVAAHSRAHVVIIKGRFIGPGYKSKFTDDACAESFELEEIVHERGAQDVLIY